MFTRRQALIGGAASIGSAVCAAPLTGAAPTSGAAPLGSAGAAGGRPPNIVLVLADDLGYGELGSYGQQRIVTPHLDRLARQGLRFTNAYSGAAVCAPSRSALLTGLHTGHGPVRTNPRGEPESNAFVDGDTTFAEVLRARGYRTGLFGKWGFGPERADQASHPNARGFEEFVGYITHVHAHDYYPSYLWHNGSRLRLPENVGANRTYAPDVFQQRARRFIRAHRNEPFLLVATTNLPHSPSDVPRQGRYAARDWPLADRRHAAQVTRLDSYIGGLVEELRDNGLLESTVIVVTSDNGPHEEGGVNPDRFNANGPLRGYKRNLFEGGIRVPLIVWAPGRIQAGVSRRLTQHTDLLPTFAELAGVPAPRDIDGRSFRSLIRRSPVAAPAQPFLYFFRLDAGRFRRSRATEGERITNAAEAIREGRWKLIRWAPGEDRDVPDHQWQVELYDLSRDVGERRNVAASHPTVVQRLVGHLRASWSDRVQREAYGVTVRTSGPAVPGGTVQVTATFGNASALTWDDARLALTVPAGWSALQDVSRDVGTLEPGEQRTVTWWVRVPADADTSARQVRVIGYAAAGGTPLAFRVRRAV